MISMVVSLGLRSGGCVGVEWRGVKKGSEFCVCLCVCERERERERTAV